MSDCRTSWNSTAKRVVSFETTLWRAWGHTCWRRLDLQNRDDAMVPIHNDDLVIVDEVEITAPIRVVLDQHRRHFHDPNRCWHDGANRDVEVDVGHPRRTAAAQHGLAHLG